jgi:uncharacterized phiE125 gp8 family phage protein
LALTKLDTLSATPVVSAADLAVHLRIIGCAGDALDAAATAQLQALATVATVDAENRLQRSLVPARWRLRLDAFPADGVIALRMPPVTSVESVSYIDSGGQQRNLSTADWYVMTDGDVPRLVPALGARWPGDVANMPGAVQVVYQAGYAAGTVPEPVRQWIMLAVADLSEQPSRSSDKPAVPQSFADALLDTYRVVVV